MKNIFTGLLFISILGTLYAQRYSGPIIDMHMHAYISNHHNTVFLL